MQLHPENEGRADWAQHAMDTFMRETFGGQDFLTHLCVSGPGGDVADAIADLICDLGHLCARHGIDYDAVLEQAASNFAHETRPDYDGA